MDARTHGSRVCATLSSHLSLRCPLVCYTYSVQVHPNPLSGCPPCSRPVPCIVPWVWVGNQATVLSWTFWFPTQNDRAPSTAAHSSTASPFECDITCSLRNRLDVVVRPHTLRHGCCQHERLDTAARDRGREITRDGHLGFGAHALWRRGGAFCERKRRA